MAIANTGVKATFNADGNSVQYVDGLIGRMDKLNKVVSGELMGKLQSVFAIGGIEEAIRRTGQWADQLRQSAAEVGLNVTELQALRLAAERVGIGQDKLITFYDKLEAAILGAANGNVKFQQSFKALGVTLDDNKTKAQLFNEIISKVGGAKEGQFDASLREIFGKQYGNVARLGSQVGAGGVAGYQKQHEDEILPEKDVNSLADTYHQIILDFKDIGVKLAPVANLILNIIGGLVSMIKGVVFAISDFIKGIPNFFQHPLDTLGHLGRNTGIVGQGIVKMGAGIVDFASMGHTNLKDKYSKYVAHNDELMGISPELRKNYEAAGEGLITVISAGDAGILGKASKLTSKVGLSAEVGDVAGVATSGIDKLKNYLMSGKVSEYATQLGVKDVSALSQSEMDALTSMVLKDNPTLAKTQDALGMLQKNIPLALAGTYGAIANNPNDFSPTPYNPTIGELKQSSNSLNLALGMGAVGGMNSNLSIGGISGIDLQTRLVTLTETIVSFLQQIVSNTAGLNVHGISQSNSVTP